MALPHNSLYTPAVANGAGAAGGARGGAAAAAAGADAGAGGGAGAGAVAGAGAGAGAAAAAAAAGPRRSNPKSSSDTTGYINGAAGSEGLQSAATHAELAAPAEHATSGPQAHDDGARSHKGYGLASATGAGGWGGGWGGVWGGDSKWSMEEDRGQKEGKRAGEVSGCVGKGVVGGGEEAPGVFHTGPSAQLATAGGVAATAGSVAATAGEVAVTAGGSVAATAGAARERGMGRQAVPSSMQFLTGDSMQHAQVGWFAGRVSKGPCVSASTHIPSIPAPNLTLLRHKTCIMLIS